MNIAQAWQICLNFEYDQRSLVSSLGQWIDTTGARAILDAACGTGFPTIELLKRGYPITCSDGSSTMLKEFRRNAQATGISAEPHCVLWQDLAKHFAEQFDVVMCRGSSLIYADTWEGETQSNKLAIREAIRNFYECLRANGILYLDTTAEGNLTNIVAESRTYQERVIFGKKTKLSEMIITDRDRRIRTWNITIVVDGKVHEFERKSCYLPHEELFDELRAAGFDTITPTYIVGEHYSVFTAKRSAR